MAEEATDRAGASGREAAAKSQRERRAAEERAAEASAALARERADRKADAASFGEERKELQVLLDCWIIGTNPQTVLLALLLVRG